MSNNKDRESEHRKAIERFQQSAYRHLVTSSHLWHLHKDGNDNYLTLGSATAEFDGAVSELHETAKPVLKLFGAKHVDATAIFRLLRLCIVPQPVAHPPLIDMNVALDNLGLLLFGKATMEFSATEFAALSGLGEPEVSKRRTSGKLPALTLEAAREIKKNQDGRRKPRRVINGEWRPK
jgi:hypothetical protein